MSRYTVATMWQDAVLDIGSPLYETTDRLNLINSSIDGVFHLIHGFYGNYFTRSVPLIAAANGKIATSGTRSFSYATNRVTMSALTNGVATVGFGIADVGRKAGMIIGGNCYEVVISAYVSTTVVTVAGNVLPTSDQTIDYFFVFNSVHAESGVILLSGIRMNVLSTMKVSLESTATNYVDAVSADDFRQFRTSSIDNRDRIVYSFEGGQLVCKAGTSLTNLGSMTLHYPSMPTVVTATTSTIDLPDGLPVFMGLELLKAKILHREGKVKDVLGSMAKFTGLFGELRQSFGLEADSEKDTDKIKALI